MANIKEVRFHLTTISGSCLMLVSTRLLTSLQDFEVVVKEVAAFNDHFSPEYYVVVQGLELSHYSLTAVVVRGQR